MSRRPVEALLPTTLGGGRIPYARGCRAGDWIFSTGTLAAESGPALARCTGNPDRPLTGEPVWYREAAQLFERTQEVLRAGGADFGRVVRTDQYYPDWRAVPFFHQARRKYCGGYIAPSTSILQPGLLLPAAGMAMETIALHPGSGLELKPFYPADLEVPSTSGFAPVVAAGDFVFIAGFLAGHKPGDLGGIAPEAKPPEGHLWKGNRIQLEAEYVITRKLAPALKAAGSSFASVVKAQVYLADINDVPAFNQVWSRHFGGAIPATTFVPTASPGFAMAEARLEINLVALRDGAAANKTRLGVGSPCVCTGHPAAVRAGDLLLFSGLVAADENGPVPGTRVDPAEPYFGSSMETQMEYLLDAVEATCAAAGTTLANVVRIQQFHTDLTEFYAASKVWQRRLPGTPLPVSAIQVPGPLLVPECTVQLDLWFYIP